jgi:hypothetical protein
MASHLVPTARNFNRKRRIIAHAVRMLVRHLTIRCIKDHGIDGGHLSGIARRL